MNQELVEVGIIVPARNAARFLRHTLGSIEVQSLRDWICVVIDDGSADDTAEITREFTERDERFMLLQQASAGPCAARNRGMGLLSRRAEFLTFMDADDVWLPQALERLVAVARADPEAIGAHALAEFIDENGEPYLPGVFAALGRSRLGCSLGWPRPWDPMLPTSFENVVTQSVLFPPGLIVARSWVYRAVGPFDESVRFAEDWDMLIRLARFGHIAFVDDVLLWYRRHENNLGTSTQVPDAARRVRQKTFYSPENTAEQRRTVRDAWRAAQVIDAAERLRFARSSIHRRHWRTALAQCVRLPLLVLRFLRGRPALPSSFNEGGRRP